MQQFQPYTEKLIAFAFEKEILEISKKAKPLPTWIAEGSKRIEGGKPNVEAVP